MRSENEAPNRYPDFLLRTIGLLATRLAVEVYVVGGTVRDWLRGIWPRDLDLAVSHSALDFARTLAADLHGTFVLLDEEEQTARVIWKENLVDIAGFRGGAQDICTDLLLRDLSINAMAIRFQDFGNLNKPKEEVLIDPADGLSDLRKGIIRLLGQRVLTDDPLRLLRAFRFFAENGFVIEPYSWQIIVTSRELIRSVSPERISHELDCIIASCRAADTIELLVHSGVLPLLLPELAMGGGIRQPASHHLDVMRHNIETLRRMEEILSQPADYYPEQGEVISSYLACERKILWLKWAALFHDLGKPSVCKIIDKRITFYNHDRVGGELVGAIAQRLRWSKEKTSIISKLIALHMWPFHLSNSRRKKEITAKACLKLYRAAGKDLTGLFLLAMADSLAGQGSGKPENMEKELAALYRQIHDICRTRVEPVFASPRLVTGNDLIAFGLKPGPHFKKILSEVENAQVEGTISNRDQALDWLRQLCLSFDLI